MKEELENKLMEDFPWMEARNVFSGEKLGFGMPCECDSGWYNLIHNLCKEIDDLYKSKNINIIEIIDGIHILQIKEKFGGLRFYVGNYIDGVDEIIDKYGDLSYETCEICGEKGNLSESGYWVKTLCPICCKNTGYKEIKEENENVQ